MIHLRKDFREEREWEKEISRTRVVRRNSCHSCRPIFYFVPEETQRHLCHKPKTRYVLADYGWSPPCSVSKPFIETIDERDLLNSTAPFLPFPPSLTPLAALFSGGGNAQRALIRNEKLSIRTCMAPAVYMSNLVSFFYVSSFFSSRGPRNGLSTSRVNERGRLIARTLIIALRRQIIDRVTRIGCGNYGGIIV